MLNPIFKFAPYQIEEANYYPIKCIWAFQENHQNKDKVEKEQNAILFAKGCSMPNAKALTFHRDGNIHLKLCYENPPPGINELLGKLRVNLF